MPGCPPAGRSPEEESLSAPMSREPTIRRATRRSHPSDPSRNICSMLTSNQKGAIAELEIAAAAAKLGVEVYRPLGEHSRADLVLDIAGRLLRVQCKWGRLGLDGDVVIARIGGSSCSPSGYVLTSYREGEVDLFGIYCGELDRAFLMPASLCVERQEIRLRLTPARNSQRACINLADQYDFAGAIAQLGERSAGSRKVGGSSPPSSTPPSVDLPAEVGVNRFRDQLSYWMDQRGRWSSADGHPARPAPGPPGTSMIECNRHHWGPLHAPLHPARAGRRLRCRAGTRRQRRRPLPGAPEASA